MGVGTAAVIETPAGLGTTPSLVMRARSASETRRKAGLLQEVNGLRLQLRGSLRGRATATARNRTGDQVAQSVARFPYRHRASVPRFQTASSGLHKSPATARQRRL